MMPFSVALAAKPQPVDIDVQTLDPVQFQFARGKLTVSQPGGKAAMQHLIEVYPDSVTLADLHAGAGQMLVSGRAGQDRDAAMESIQSLAAAMLGACSAGLLKLYVRPFSCCREVSRQPRATPLNRHWAARKTLLVNAWHEDVLLDELQSHLLARLDGNKDRRALAWDVQQAVEWGNLSCDSPVEEAVDRTLANLAARGLLAG
jgi:hypothetical protein